MSQYLLSTYTVEDQVPGAPTTPEEMQEFMGRVIALGSRDGPRAVPSFLGAHFTA